MNQSQPSQKTAEMYLVKSLKYYLYNNIIIENVFIIQMILILLQHIE